MKLTYNCKSEYLINQKINIFKKELKSIFRVMSLNFVKLTELVFTYMYIGLLQVVQIVSI
jgi:hypothetical protein